MSRTQTATSKQGMESQSCTSLGHSHWSQQTLPPSVNTHLLSQITAGAKKEPPEWGRVTWALSDQVQTERKEPDYIGAAAHTNNTGEMSAMYYALSRALTRKKGIGREIIWSDSLYTINMSTGKWMSRTKRNQNMVGLLCRTWRQLQRWRPGEVTLRHVRSHVLVPGNELISHKS